MASYKYNYKILFGLLVVVSLSILIVFLVKKSQSNAVTSTSTSTTPGNKMSTHIRSDVIGSYEGIISANNKYTLLLGNNRLVMWKNENEVVWEIGIPVTGSLPLRFIVNTKGQIVVRNVVDVVYAIGPEQPEGTYVAEVSDNGALVIKDQYSNVVYQKGI